MARITNTRHLDLIHARDCKAMAELRERGQPFDCQAFCAAIQRMLKREAEARESERRKSEPLFEHS